MKKLIKLLTLDVLKPHDPAVVEYADKLVRLKGVSSVDITVVELDSKTETLQINLEGDGMELDSINITIKELGGTLHSVDRVVAAKKKLKDINMLKNE